MYVDDSIRFNLEDDLLEADEGVVPPSGEDWVFNEGDADIDFIVSYYWGNFNK